MRAVWLISGAVNALPVISTPAVAQTPTTATIEQSNEIVVTATGRRLAAEKVPYNVTARSEKDLREDNITDIKKFFEYNIIACFIFSRT